MKIGVIACQGAFWKHLKALKKCGVNAEKIIIPEQLDDIKGLIIEGDEGNILSVLKDKFKKKQIPIFGICAGMILLAKNFVNNKKQYLGLMDITLGNNFLGERNKSYVKPIKIPIIGNKPFNAVFINAPYIVKVAPNVGILSQINDDKIIFVRQGNYLAASFHPELTDDLRVYKYFIKMVEDSLNNNNFFKKT